jgi:hypothetical protein
MNGIHIEMTATPTVAEVEVEIVERKQVIEADLLDYLRSKAENPGNIL